MSAIGTNTMHTIWDASWVNPSESPWCTMNKFALANACGTSYFAAKGGGVATHNRLLGLVSRRRIDFGKYLMLLPITYRKELYIDSMPNKKDHYSLSDHIVSAKLRYCPVCLAESGYHSMLHQSVLHSKCPIHDMQLTTSCPFCHREMPYIIDLLIQGLPPFGCPLCGEPLFRKSLTPALINIWTNHSTASIIESHRTPQDKLYIFSTSDSLVDLSAKIVRSIHAVRESEDIDLGRYYMEGDCFNNTKTIYRCDLLQALYFHAIKKIDAVIVEKHGIHISNSNIDLNKILCRYNSSSNQDSSGEERKACAYLLWAKEMYDYPIIRNSAAPKNTFVMKSISRIFAIDFTMGMIDTIEARKDVGRELCYKAVLFVLMELLEKRYGYWLSKIEKKELQQNSYYEDCRKLPQVYFVLLFNTDLQTAKIISISEDE